MGAETESKRITQKWKKYKMEDSLRNEMSSEGLMEIEELDEESTIAILKKMGIKDVDLSLPSQKKTKSKRAKLIDNESSTTASNTNEEIEEANLENVTAAPVNNRTYIIGASKDILQTLPPLSDAWKKLSDELDLAAPLVHALRALKFNAPTRIQADCIPPAIAHRADVVGAAETGSGKTLAFAIPVVQNALRSFPDFPPPSLNALVILPSRELAQQVAEVFKKLTMFATHLRTVTIVGGLSEEKQKRQLKQTPSFAIGTPGRLLALMKDFTEVQDESDSENQGGKILKRLSALSDLSGLRSLVLDESDRLIEAGHFKELDDILAEVYKQVLVTKSDRLQTFVFSATLSLAQRQGKSKKAMAIADGEADFVNGINNNKNKNKDGKQTTEDRVDELMRRVKLRERKLHVCSLEKGSALETSDFSSSFSNSGLSSSKVSLPQTLSLEMLQVMDKDKELHLFNYLMHAAALALAAKQQWKCLLFVNAITYARRLEPLLKLFFGQGPNTQGLKGSTFASGVPSLLAVGQSLNISSMHAQMQQKQRIVRLERFRKSQLGLLICTDVAARGLDIPDVDTVVMLQPARDGPTFVHRAGRTARAGKKGTCVCFCAPGDVSAWQTALKSINSTPDELPAPSESVSVNANGLSMIRSVFQNVLEIDKMLHSENKKKKEKMSFKSMAEAADLIYSDDDDDNDGIDEREKHDNERKAKSKCQALYQSLSYAADRVYPAVRTIAMAAAANVKK